MNDDERKIKEKKLLSTRLLRNINQLIIEQGLTVSILEQKVGCSNGYLSKMFKEEIFNPSLNLIVDISKALCTSIDTLVDIPLPDITEQDTKIFDLIDMLCKKTSQKEIVWDIVEINTTGNSDLREMSVEDKFQHNMFDYKKELDNEDYNYIITTKHNFDAECSILLYQSNNKVNSVIYKCCFPIKKITIFLVVGKTSLDINEENSYELYLCDKNDECHVICGSGYKKVRSIFSPYLERLNKAICENFSKVYQGSSLEALIDELLDNDTIIEDRERNITAQPPIVYKVEKQMNVQRTFVKNFKLKNEQYSLERRLKTWANFLRELVDVLYKKNPDKFKELAKNHWSFQTDKARRPSITNYLPQGSNLARYYELDESSTKIYVCLNYSANDIRDFAYTLVKEFGYDEDSLVINVFDRK